MSLEKSAYLASALQRNIGDTNALYAKLASVLGKSLKAEGLTATAAALNALTTPMPGLLITITTGGTLTLGSLSVSTNDTVYFNGLIWVKAQWVAMTSPAASVVLTDNYSLVAADSGVPFLIGTDAKVISLPATAAGLIYRIVNIGAAGNNIVTISPVAADGISGTITLASSVVVDAGVVNKDLINTKATSQCGDSVTLLGTGVTGTHAWIILSSTGIWAAQA